MQVSFLPIKTNVRFGAVSPFTAAQSKITRFLHEKGHPNTKYARSFIAPRETPSLIIEAVDETTKNRIEADLKTMPGITWESQHLLGFESFPLFTVDHVLLSVGTPQQEPLNIPKYDW
jgi:hypothetical protein